MTRKLPLGLLFSSSAGIETADKAIYGAKNRLRHDLIGYLKRMPDGSNLYFEEIRTGRRTTPGRQCRGPGAHRRGHARGPGLDITPALRENAMRGLPLFSRRSDEHARGLRSAKEALLNKSEVVDAVTHSTLGPTTIGYGAPGSAKKDYKVGDWRSHIIVRRTLEGEDPGETLVRVINANGKPGRRYGTEGRRAGGCRAQRLHGRRIALPIREQGSVALDGIQRSCPKGIRQPIGLRTRSVWYPTASGCRYC